MEQGHASKDQSTPIQRLVHAKMQDTEISKKIQVVKEVFPSNKCMSCKHLFIDANQGNELIPEIHLLVHKYFQQGMKTNSQAEYLPTLLSQKCCNTL